jgi:hypothetical protein
MFLKLEMMYEGDMCAMAEQYEGRALYYNIGCLWDWLTGWVT